MTIATIPRKSATLSDAAGHARVLFFGRIADACGRSLDVPVPRGGCSLDDFKARLAELLDAGADALSEPCIRVAIDQVMSGKDAWVSPGQEVAFLSAFSGG